MKTEKIKRIIQTLWDAVEIIGILKRRINLVSKKDTEVVRIEKIIDGCATSLIEWMDKLKLRKTTSTRTEKRIVSDSRSIASKTSPSHIEDSEMSKQAPAKKR